jgi:hypothetical protein
MIFLQGFRRRHHFPHEVLPAPTRPYAVLKFSVKFVLTLLEKRTPPNRFVRPQSGIRHASYSPVRLAPVMPAAVLLRPATPLRTKTMSVNWTSRHIHVLLSRHVMGACRCPVRLCCVLSGNSDESTQHIQPGHLRVALPSHTLAALAVGGQPALLPPRYAAGAVLARVRSASRVPSPVALVAAVRLSLPRPHRQESPAVSVS